MTSPFSPAEQALLALGVTTPREIDVEVVAYSMGARVCHYPLATRDAVIWGEGDAALIIVDKHAGRHRQRFSIAHELGHWHHHRGERVRCALSDTPSTADHAVMAEREADAYAADLLMPAYLLDPFIAGKPPSMALVRSIARSFEVSLLAAALRLIERTTVPAMLVVDRSGAASWYRRSSAMGSDWYRRPDPDADAMVHDQRVIASRAWFLRHPPSARFLHQHAEIAGDTRLTLLTPVV